MTERPKARQSYGPRFILLAGWDHPPSQGWNAYQGGFDSPQQARNWITHRGKLDVYKNDDYGGQLLVARYDWAEVVDTDTMRKITEWPGLTKEGKRQAGWASLQ